VLVVDIVQIEPPRRQEREESKQKLGALGVFAVKNFQQHSTGRLSEEETPWQKGLE
jgi:hypothetical protein